MRNNSAKFSSSVLGYFKINRLHADLKLSKDGAVWIRRHDLRPDESSRSFSEFDLKKFWLPPNEVCKAPVSLLSRDDLVFAILLFLNDFMFRTRSAKGRHDRARTQSMQCIKFFEYIWLRGYLKLSSVHQSVMIEFAEDIAVRGWIGVLNIRSRVHEISARNSECCSLTREEFSTLLATNIQGSDFGLVYGSYVSLRSEDNISILEDTPLGYSSMRHLLGSLNQLHGLADGIGLKKYPYLNSVALSRSLTSAPYRTPNIGPRDAAILLSGSFEIILCYSELIVSLLSDVASLVIDNFGRGRFELGAGIERLVIASGVDKKIIFPKQPGKNSSDGIGGNYVCALILLVMSACFVILAICNARRRDEIQHKKYGVHFGCASVMNEELGIYTAEFYIEKTLLDYSVFFINKISFRVIRLLESIQSEFYRVDRAFGRDVTVHDKRDRNLFAYRRLSELEGVGAENCWFSFNDAKRGYIARFLNFIFPDGSRFKVSAHMFRRLYGLLFMYRHELPEFQALSYQYQHDLFSSTVTYITDPGVENDLASIFNLYKVDPEIVKKSYASHCEDVQEALLGIAKERMSELVEYTLGGGDGKGGFTKFLKSVYRKYLKSVEFVDLSFGARSKMVSDRFLSRGHLPNPFRHSICVASPERHSASAHCSSPVNNALRPELASPSVCQGCPFQYLNERHIENMIADSKFLSSELERMPKDSVIAKQLEEQLENLKKIIEFHEARRAV